MTDTVSLPPRHLALLRRILAHTLPNAEIWAFGSRVNGGHHETSDIDLVARNTTDPETPVSGLASARDALIESDLPMRVQLFDWSTMPKSFRSEILRRYAILQPSPEMTATRHQQFGPGDIGGIGRA